MPALPARTLLVRLLPFVASALLAGCASSHHPRAASPDRAVAARLAGNDAAVVHFLNRVTFGARDQDIGSVRSTGLEAFLDRQMHPQQIDDAMMENRLAAFETLNLTSKQIAEQYYQPAQEARRRRQAARSATEAAGALSPQPQKPTTADNDIFRRERLVLQELSEQKVLRAVYSQRQLQEVLVDFWFNHFNVFAGKGADRGLVTAYERDVIRPRVFGKFRDLLGATAESPAMLFFLDNWMSVDPNGPHPEGEGGRRRAGRPAGNAAPPAVYRLAPGSTRAAAPQQKPRRGLNENYARELLELHTLGVDGGYTQNDVVAVARCFTGWTIAQPRDGGGFTFNERQHDTAPKVVLGHVIKIGGKSDGDAVLDILARDPHTAHFIATQLVRRFVADDPPATLVARVARRFRETDGDLREVYRAIFLSEEFWSEQARRGKTKTPFELVASALRATRADMVDALSSVQALRTLGMPPYFCQPPTGYPDRADAWVNTGALLNRMNFAVALADNRLAGVRLDVASLAGSADVAAARVRFVRELFHDDVSPATRSALNQASTLPQVLALALGSPEFQRK